VASWTLIELACPVTANIAKGLSSSLSQPLRRKSIYGSVGRLSLMFITSCNFSPLRESISLADAERNNPEVILIGCRRHPEMIRHQSKYHCTTCGKRGAEVRPDFNWNRKVVAAIGYR
jgi:ribosomal protein L37E